MGHVKDFQESRDMYPLAAITGTNGAMWPRLRPSIGLVVVILCLGSAWTQESSPVTQRLPAGIYLHALLKTDLSTKYSRLGDPVELEVRRSPIGNDYQVLMSDHTRLLGKVTSVHPAGKGQAASVAVEIVEARSQSGSQTLDGILGSPVLILRDTSVFSSNRSSPNNTALHGSEALPLEGATVNPDPALGSQLTSKHNFFLVKNQAQLVIVTR